MIHARGHPIAPPSGVVAVCRLLLYDKIGPGTHPCHWCQTAIRWMPGRGAIYGAIVADHVNGDRNDDRPENIVQSCHVCNAQRTQTGTKRIGAGELHVTNPNGTRVRAIERKCVQCNTAFLARLPQVRTGKGRFCSRSCARRYARLNAD